MKKGLFLLIFISLVFFSTTVSAEEKDILIQTKDIVPASSWELVGVDVNEQTGVKFEIYEEKVLPNLLIPMAGNGQWDYVTSSVWTTSHATSGATKYKRDKTVHSTGGDFMISVPYHYVYGVLHNTAKAGISIELYEEDPLKSTHVDWRYVNPPPKGSVYHAVWRDLNGYVDGTNKKAEFYAEYAMNYIGDSFSVVYSD
ncbi:hypothetical protein [Ornithinibacillus hominis]|uniref:Uncharacterized protein n=1 Tax=Ornithinibacillus hominis TaxID=2763055 RepID=A0A923L2G0_9BACI|nr:hypothetical protein [Ornithinibacillus hominis]MBC5635206.1 hypothetical protein [Ornithinibacillus hominis]